MKKRKSVTKNSADYKLLVVAIALGLIGLLAIADASAPSAMANFSDKYYFVKQQAVWFAVGLVVMFVASFVNYKIYVKLTVSMFVIALLALILVLLPYFSSEALGARRWLYVGNFGFQPSEFAKIALILYVARLSVLSKKVVAFFVPLAVFSALIMLQPDLGTTMLIVFIFFSQIFIAGVGLKYIAYAFSASILLGVIAIFSSDYRRQRFETFVGQTSDPLGSGYHIRQILLSLGSGGLFGVGLGQSRQKYLFLPEVATDSIFAVIAEETGFIGAVVVMSLFVFYLYRALKISQNAKDVYAKVLGIGITAWVAGQTLLNIGSIVALVPLTGIPLPFISYGGSSLVTIMLGTGILLNISKSYEK